MSRASPLIAALVACVWMLGTPPPFAHALGAGGEKANNGVDSSTNVGQGTPIGLSEDGRLLFFQSRSTNLVPEISIGNQYVYVRDLETGQTEFVNVDPDLVPGREITINTPSISDDGRFVAVAGTDLRPSRTIFSSIYVNDRQTGTTKVASRASGANGTIATDARAPSLSGDGRLVAFQTESRLDPADADTNNDIYVRDLQSDTTILVSRASGPNGEKGWNHSVSPAISGDGRFVSFESSSDNLVDGGLPETRGTFVYVRDLLTDTTTLVSRANHDADPTVVTGFYGYPAISRDGRLVAFFAENSLSPDDTDSNGDIYVRDIVARTTTLVDRADGASGAKANANASTPTISADGRFVGFATAANNLSPDDSDALFDSYVRDLQNNTTTLVDRGTGISGPKASYGTAPVFSGDQKFLAFDAVARNFDPADADDYHDTYVRDLQTFQTSLESRATPGFVRPVRPKGATPLRLSLVPAAQECTSPNTTHGAPLSFGSCSPVTPTSPTLVVSSSATGAKSVGFVLLKARPGNPDTTADEADIPIVFRLTNVSRASDLSDYTGELQGRFSVTRTDKSNGPAGNEDLTSVPVDFAFTIPCAATANLAEGSDCGITTFADAVVPGFAPEGKRTVYDVGQFRVYDGGPDESAATTGDNSLLAVQGLFVP
jgi:hypothetical protein